MIIGIIIAIAIIIILLVCCGCRMAGLSDYEVVYFCDKMFITKHFNCRTDYTLIDITDLEKNKTIHLNYYYTRGPAENEKHELTTLETAVMVYRNKKGEWRWCYQ